MSSSARVRSALPATFAAPARPKLLALLRQPRSLVMLSSAGGQLLGFACAPVLSRLYSPADFGAFVLFSSTFNLLNIVLSGRYEQAIYYTRRAYEVAGLATLAGLLSLGSAAVFVGVALPATLFEQRSDLAKLVPLVALSALASVLTRVVSLLIVRWKKLRELATLNFLRPCSVATIQTALGSLWPSTLTLAVAHALANVLVFAVAWLRVPTARSFVRRMPRGELIALLRAQRTFPLYNLPQNLVFVLSDAIVPLLAASRFGAAYGGLYWFAARLTTAPIQVLVESVRLVVSDQLVRRVQGGQPGAPWALWAALKLALPFLLAAAVLGAGGPLLFEFVFGATWRDAGAIAALLFVYAAVNAAGVPWIAALPLTGLQGQHLAVESLVLLAKAALIYLAARDASFLDTIALTVGAAVVGYVAFYGLIWWRLRELDAQATPGGGGANAP